MKKFFCAAIFFIFFIFFASGIFAAAAIAPAETAQPGDIDPALVGGSWNRNIVSSNRRYSFYFNGDGTFEFFQHIKNATQNVKGKYTASDGKIYFSEMYFVYADGTASSKPDLTAEYRIDTDDKGVYLAIGDFVYTDGFSPILPNATPFRRKAGRL
jgi:hypothetical protein